MRSQLNLGRRLVHRAEWPTWLVAIACYGGLALVIACYHALPWWITLPLGAWFVAWHGSLQHEAVHGHPTRLGWLNHLLVFPPLGLAIPFAVYRDTHLAHHACGDLTRPGVDPESFYVLPENWRRMHPALRALLWFNNTLLGRLTIGPVLMLGQTWCSEARRVAAGDRRRFLVWSCHAAAVAGFLAVIWALADIPAYAYVGLFAYPGLSLVLLRSYLEHRPADAERGRTAIVEAGPLMRLLYLNNNFHAVHHERPGLPWFALPAAHRADRGRAEADGEGYVLRGYGEIAYRYLLRPKDAPVFPFDAAPPVPPFTNSARVTSEVGS